MFCAAQVKRVDGGFPPRNGARPRGGVGRAVGGEGRRERDGLAGLERARGPGAEVVDLRGHVGRRPAARLEAAEGDVRVKVLVVGGIAGASGRRGDGPLEVGKSLDTGAGHPDPEDARPLRVGECSQTFEPQLHRAERGGGFPHREADRVQVGVVDVAEERERDVELRRLDPARPGDLGREQCLEPGEFRAERGRDLDGDEGAGRAGHRGGSRGVFGGDLPDFTGRRRITKRRGAVRDARPTRNVLIFSAPKGRQ